MDAIIIYLADRYILFIILTILMLFALAGYFAKKKSKESQAYKIADNNAKAEEELESLAQKVNKGASIQDFMKQSATTNSSMNQQQGGQVQQEQLTSNNQTQQQSGIENLDVNYPNI